MRVGILGTGRIAHIVAKTLRQTEGTECFAVASRTAEKAEAFRSEFGMSRAYGSYEQLVADEEVELVYVATPNTQHYDCMRLCVRYGKPVLCEKSFTVNAKQARAIYELAAARQSFVAEAMWTRYMPSRRLIDETLQSGVIGRPRVLNANLCYVTDGKNPRLTDPKLGGGALLDVAVYGLNFALMHFGCDIERVSSSVCMGETGVDELDTMTLTYKDGRIAILTHGIRARSDRRAVIYGDKGYLVVENLNNPQSVSVYDLSGALVSRTDAPKAISGYEYEFEACARALAQGLREVPEMPLRDSVRAMEILDTVREQWGFRFPCEEQESE